jgi:hypothetical protein
MVCQHEDDYIFQADEVYLALKRLDANSHNPNELLLELEKHEIETKGFFMMMHRHYKGNMIRRWRNTRKRSKRN